MLERGSEDFFDDINYILTACSERGLSKLLAVRTIYQQAKDSQFTKTVLKDQPKALEDNRQELYHKLTEAEDEKQQLTERLKTTEEERQQLKDTLKTTEEERQQLTGRLKTMDEERQQFKDALKTTEEERQQFEDALRETDRDFRNTLNTAENKLKTLKDEKEELL
ncbi:hypothetical protein BSL78_15528 [Apostichopus japonicus]|uniref:Uncharacterized protein n=1 Tax=Stichopus japonicus TaxID=307972 RepID=A0A2G8KI08_STIJA|nr:hypothetical protein BSL78_15528 [Apostichopus japonicus]